MKNVREAAHTRAVLASYHPLWLRLGVEVVVGRRVSEAGERGRGQGGNGAQQCCSDFCATQCSTAVTASACRCPCLPPDYCSLALSCVQARTRRCRALSWRRLCATTSSRTPSWPGSTLPAARLTG